MENNNGTPKYTTILHRVRIELDISCNEYCVADIIFSLSNNPDAKISGWCFATKETIANFLGISKRTIHEIINRLIEKGLVEKDPESKYLKTTSLWYQSVVLERLKIKNVNREESSHIGKKVPYAREESSLQVGKKVPTYNNNIINTSIKEISSKEDNASVVPLEEKKEYGRPDINELLKDFEEIIGFKSAGGKKDRIMATHLLKNFSSEELKRMLEFCFEDKFIRVGSLCDLWYQRSKVLAGMKNVNKDEPEKLSPNLKLIR